MKSILQKVKINNYTYLFFLICFLCGYIKNICILFMICVIHELGHVFFIKVYKYKIDSIEISPFGGYTNIDKRINTSINKDIIISLGGIVFQLFFILLIMILKNYLNSITYNLIIKYNYVFILFNLIPIIPLDGNNIVHLFLEKILPYTLAYIMNIVLSFIFLIIFIMFNIQYQINNYFIIIFLIFKVILSIKNYKYLRNRFLLERYLYEMEYRKINSNTKDIDSLRKEVLHYFYKDNRYINEKEYLKRHLLFDKKA